MLHVGLSENEVLKIRAATGENILPERETVSGKTILISQFESPLILILFLVAGISLFFREFFDAALVSAVVILNISMGFFQEYSSHKTLASLKNILKPTALVIREGVRREIEIRELVPGDLVVLTSGDKVPADGKLLETAKLLIDESLLTGESQPVEKNLNEKKNVLFMGTTILSGKGLMQVTKIGVNSEMGKIGASISEIIDEKTPLQKKLEIFSRHLMFVIIFICFVIFLFELFHHDLWEATRLSIILSIAAIPEGLPIAVTVILAIGMRKILKKRGLVKKLLSIETLGSTSVICTDKTGTLTEGKMKVVKTDFKDEIKAQLTLILNNEQKDGLEHALWEFVKNKKEINPQKIIEETVKTFEDPFDSVKKYALCVAKIGQQENAYILGAPEIVLNFCQTTPLERQKIDEKIQEWGSEGLKILGCAVKETGNLKEKSGFSWIGLVAIDDPVRAGVKETIVTAANAGIKIKIVTGDYQKTAENVARRLGFQFGNENSIDGAILGKMTDAQLTSKINDLVIFSRITPLQKLRIIDALKNKGEIVAMTGDGANDAPALKKADIGVVIGTATDVAKEAGDLILLDGNFTTIVAAIEEGRRILANIKKVVAYVLSNSFVEIILILGAAALKLAAPLTVVQILWIHLICDGPPDIALGFEPKEKEVMKATPQEVQREEILPTRLKFLILTISLTVGLTALVMFQRFAVLDLKLARSVVFATVGAVSLIYIFSFKNMKKLIFKTDKFFKNIYLLLSVLYGFILLAVAIYVPFFNRVLHTTPLSFSHWIFVFGVGLLATAIIELSKLFSN